MNKSKIFCTSLDVAEEFERSHAQVLRDIRRADCSEGFRKLNYKEEFYRNEKGKKRSMFYMTFNGFMNIIRTYKDEKAIYYKILYVQNTDPMEVARLGWTPHDPIPTEAEIYLRNKKNRRIHS